MNDKQLELIKNMEHWKNCILSNDFSFEKSIGVESIEDLLDGISACDDSGVYFTCIASELVSRLSKVELDEVEDHLLSTGDFARIDFEGLSVDYYLNTNEV